MIVGGHYIKKAAITAAAKLVRDKTPLSVRKALVQRLADRLKVKVEFPE